MKKVPVFELFAATSVGLIAIVLMAFDIFGKSEPFYYLMNGIMPEWGWALLCLVAFSSQFGGLFWEVRSLRYIGLTLTCFVYLFLFIINLFNFPNLMTGVNLSIAIFCVVAMVFVKETDLLHREKEEKRAVKKASHH